MIFILAKSYLGQWIPCADSITNENNGTEYNERNRIADWKHSHQVSSIEIEENIIIIYYWIELWTLNEHFQSNRMHSIFWFVQSSVLILSHCDGTMNRQLHSFPYNRICENLIMILMDVRPQSNCMTKCNCNCNCTILNYLVNFRFSWFVTVVDRSHSDFNSFSVAIMFIVRFIDVGQGFRILSSLSLIRGWAAVTAPVTSSIYWAYLGGIECSFGRGIKLFPTRHCCFYKYSHKNR